MGEVSNSQAFEADSNPTLLSGLVGKFKTAMDTVLQGGRDISIHLPPQKSPCPASCRYNSSYKVWMGTDGKLCQSCKGQGFLLEHRWTVYRANIRQIDQPFEDAEVDGQDTNAGRVSQAMVRTKTVIQSYDHIKSSIGAEIDGEQYKLWRDPQKTGFGGSLLYVVTHWKRMDK